MSEEILNKIMETIQKTLEEKMHEKYDELVKEFKDYLNICMQKEISQIMSNVIVRFNQDVNNEMNYTITFRILDKVEENSK